MSEQVQQEATTIQPMPMVAPNQPMPTTPEGWQARAKSLQDQHETAKEAYVRQKAKLAEVEKAMSDENWSADKITANQERYDSMANQIIVEKQALSFAQANRAMARGNLQMCQAHMQALQIKPKRTRTATPRIVVEDTPEVKAIKADMAKCEEVSNQIRTDKAALREREKAFREKMKGEFEKIDSRFKANNAKMGALMQKLEDADPVTKARNEKRRKAKEERAKNGGTGTPGRKSKFAGNVLTIPAKIKTNPYTAGTAAALAFVEIDNAEKRTISYESLQAKGVASKTVSAMVKDGNVTAKPAPAKA